MATSFFPGACLGLLASGVLVAQVPEAPDRVRLRSAPEQNTSAAPVPTRPASPARDLTSADLEAFVDGLVPLQLERSDLGGAVVLLARGQQMLLFKGYGYAVAKSKTPVNPETTLFRLASISKLFTWISVMQQVEAGKLDLDTDVNRYLDFTIRPKWDKPVTLRNLMTHTGGFEDTIRDILLIDPKQKPALRDYLIEDQPSRIFPPGQVAAYSNYGVGLAGYIVQRISGQPFESYAQEHIFDPLGMHHSSFFQPLPKELSGLVSDGYKATAKPPLGFEIFSPAPAGGLSSTAGDMLRFAHMLLRGGELEGHRILKPETLAQMWTRQFGVSERMPAMDMGFYQLWRNGLHFVGHAGDLAAFHSEFLVEPEQKLIFFVAYNSAGNDDRGGRTARPELLESFLNRYFPYDVKSNARKISADEAAAIEGIYQPTRRTESSRLKLNYLFNQTRAFFDKEGFIKVDAYKNRRGVVQRWRPGEGGVLEEVDGQAHLYPVRDARGGVVRLAGDFPGSQAERIPWYERSRLILPLLAASTIAITLAAFLLLGRMFKPIGMALRRRWRARLTDEQKQLAETPPAGATSAPVRLRLGITAQIASLLWFTGGVVLTAFLSLHFQNADLPPGRGIEIAFWIQNVILIAAALLSLPALFSAISVWNRPLSDRGFVVRSSLLAISFLFLIWFSWHWHLIGSAHL